MLLDLSFSKMTLLIAVDDGPLLESLKNMVRDFGVVSLYTGHDLKDDFTKLRGKPVDMVFCDYGLAPLDGLEFVRRIRQGKGAADPATPVIMLADDDERGLVEAAKDIGVNGFIDKPLSPSSLYTCMMSVKTRLRDFIQTERYIGPDRRAGPRTSGGAKRDGGNKDAERVVVDWAKVKAAMTATPTLPEPPFIKSAHNDIQAIIRALDEATRDPARRRPAMRLISSLAGFIMEQGLRANYPLMSSIAESLHNSCRKAALTGVYEFELIRSHINAMAAMISDETSGQGRGQAMDGAILDLLCSSARQQNIHPQPVNWPRANVQPA